MRKSETNPIRDKGKIEEKSTSTMIERKESNKKSGPMSPSKNDQNNTVNKTDSISKDTIASKEDSLTSNNNLMKKMTIVDPKEETTNKISNTKDPLDKLKKEDLIIKIKEYEEKLKQEKEEKKKLIETKNKELENKDKVIFSVGGTNKKLLIELEELKKEVDEKLDKIGLKQIKDTEKEIEMKKKQQPLEHLLKVKEKELKNALTLLDVLKKDKESLQKNLNEKSDFNKVISLQDKLKEEENKNIQLEIEIKLFQKMNDEHNKCVTVKSEFEKDKKQMTSEMKFLKDKNKELKNKIKEEEQKIGELSTKLAESKSCNTTSNVLITQNTNPTQSNQNNSNLPNIKNNDPKNKNINKINTSQELQNIQKYWSMLESADKILAKDDSALVQKKKLPKTDKEYKDFLSKERHKFSHSLQNKNFKMPESNEARPKLFGHEEKQILSKLLPITEISKLEKKFEMIDSSKAALERKYATELKIMNKKVSDLEERLEMTLLQNKEAEQKNKILSFQINEHKNENKILSRKLVELNNKLKGLNLLINEKEEENKRIIKQLQESNNYSKKLEEGGNSISKTYNESNIEDLEEREVVHEPTEENIDNSQEPELEEDQKD